MRTPRKPERKAGHLQLARILAGKVTILARGANAQIALIRYHDFDCKT